MIYYTINHILSKEIRGRDALPVTSKSFEEPGEEHGFCQGIVGQIEKQKAYFSMLLKMRKINCN